ncbi:SAM domain (Sterile alpha motif) [Ruegeria halocynthiae]|uniref:SAM domain (Sterile alpha motif) n=1 Tax=Ruegeria halocynthiae TaxID=985054 RepID=A0A1H3FA32_9RHOB|nr:adenylate/guanylate cyclase domain-containing protein [Ruegeria halocynthiae]SDX87821.1 SAM domain (Sterile alpha motif) [Ruegeria halocynthiae]
MDQLKAWLDRHSLSKHYDVFAKNSVDLEIISDLEEADFAELGLNMGDRKRMMRALRTFDEASTSSPGRTKTKTPVQSVTDQSGNIVDTTEKLHLTMMFVDLVESTTLSSELELEDYRDVIHQYQRVALEAIGQHHGHVAQFIGDAVTAYFGYPTAAEDDAERAVLAGLDICGGVSKHLSVAGRTIQARIGIATGDLVVEEQSIREGLAYGDTPNLAARIMATAQPGKVAISDRTKRLLGTSIECEWLGEYKLKGFQKPQGVWSVNETTETGLRFRSRQKHAISPMVDREDEMRLLESRWRAVCDGQTQTVLLSGEAGIGKSRLVEELGTRIDEDGGNRLNFQCSVHHKGSALFPLVSLVNQAARIRRSDAQEQQASKLRRLLNGWFSGPDNERAFALFANLLSIRTDVSDRVNDLSPEQLKTQLNQLLVNLAVRLSDRRPVLLLFEDLHWADPSTEELIDLLIERLDQHRVMILCTSRPEYKLRWTGLASVTSLTVPRLDDHFARQMMRNVLLGEIAAPEIETQIIQKSDGVPLFLEEMAHMVRRRLNDADSAHNESDIISLPSTLKDLLRAKIDGLVTAREVVPVCAAIGRTIYPSMVHAVTGLSFDQARSQLDYLSEVDILVPRGNQPDRSYSFRHALIQDAAYDLMLKSRAKTLHRQIAKVIVASYPDMALQQPDLLAQHYTLAGMPAEARDSWRDAAIHSASRSATEETIQHLENALHQNSKLGNQESEIALRKMFNVALNTRAFGSRPVLENMARLHELLLSSATVPEDAFLAIHVQFGVQLMLGDAANALKMCDDFDRIAEDCNNPTMKAVGNHNRGMAMFMLGNFSAAIAQFDSALELRRHCTVEDVLRFHAADIGPVDAAMRCWAQSLRGDDPDDVRVGIETVVIGLNSEQHEFSRCYALNILATAYQPLGDIDALLDLIEEASKISNEHNFKYWEAWSGIIRSWAWACSGESTLAISGLLAGIDAYLATGSTQITQYAYTLLADTYLRGGDAERALATIEKMKADQKEGGVAYHLGVAAQIEAKIRAVV